MVTFLQDVENSDQWRVYNLFTTLWELKDRKWRDGEHRDFHAVPEGTADMGINWKEWREDKREFTKEEPAVLIIGEFVILLSGTG